MGESHQTLTNRKTALVTGAGGGIGASVVRRLMQEGVAVLATDVVEAPLRTLESEGASILVADITDAHDRRHLYSRAAVVDFLVNAAGLISMTPIEEVDEHLWNEIFNVNAAGLFFLCQHFGPRMSPGGAIVNIASIAAKTGATAETCVYAASKAAVLSITRSFANYLAPKGVRVNAICPGIVDTAMNDSVVAELSRRDGENPDEWRESRLRTVPMNRDGKPSEVAAAIWYLLSTEASYITGQNINVSGGLVNWG